MNHKNLDRLPLVSLPTDLCDEDAAQLLEFLLEAARVLQSHYAAPLHRHYHCLGQRQPPLWPDNEPPF